MNIENKIIEEKNCLFCEEEFFVYQKDRNLYDKISPVIKSKKYDIPNPQLCPSCRMQRRMSFRNERTLYKRLCDATGKEIISLYHQDSPYTVYGQEFWWSDGWSSLDYGKKYNNQKAFFDQFYELSLEVPHFNVTVDSCENANFTNDVGNTCNAFLTFRTHNSQNVAYGYRINNSNDIFDCSQVSVGSQNMYESYAVNNCYQGKFNYYSQGCSECSYVFNLQNCSYCFLCYDLENKKYCIENKQYSKDEYFKEIQKYSSEDIQKVWKTVREKTTFELINKECESCEGYNLKNCKNCFCSEGLKHCENVSYGKENTRYIDSIDCYSGGSGEKCYEVTGNIGVYESICNFRVRNSQRVMYSWNCFDCQDVFGCISLRSKQYCIFNTQYTKQEYETMLQQIIPNMILGGEWGNFFPSNISPFGYEQTVANDYFVLSEEIKEKNIFNLTQYSPVEISVSSTIEASNLPDSISEVEDSIIYAAIKCEITGKLFRITQMELDFYRKYNIALPKRHPDQRFKDRIINSK